MTDRMVKFANAYVGDAAGNAAAAVRLAGYNCKSSQSAAVVGYQLLARPDVKQLVEECQRAAAANAGITQSRVRDELAKIAFSNMQDYAHWGETGVTLNDSAELSSDAAACVAEVSETTTKDGGTIRFKLHAKIDALQALIKMLGLGADEEEVVRVVMDT